MSVAARIARNTVVLALAQAATMAVNLVLWAHLGRALGPDRFGVLGFGLALLSYFVLVVTLGFDAVGVREVARHPDRERQLVQTVLGFRLALGAMATLGFGLAVVWVAPDAIVRITLLVLGAQILARSVQLDWVYQGREQMGVVAVRNVSAAVVSAGLALALVRRPSDVVWAALALTAAQWVANLGLIGTYSRSDSFPWPGRDTRAWTRLLVPALPLAATAFAAQIYANVDKLMLAWLRTTTEVGYYEAAYKVYALAVVGSAVLYPAFYPALSAAFGDADAMRARSRAFSSALVAVGLPLTAAGAVLAPQFIDVLFDAEYAAATPALRLLFGAAGVTYISLGFGAPLMAWHRETDYMKAILVGSVANVILNAFLIGPLGTVGAAGATLLSEALVMVGMAFRFHRETGTVYPSIVLRGLVVGAAGGALPAWAATSWGWPLIPALVLVGLASILSAWAVGLVSIQTLRDALSRPPARS